MSETYEFLPDDKTGYVSLKIGKYSDSVFRKHSDSYGQDGAKKTRGAAMQVLENSLLQEVNDGSTNNILLVGKVQSGKTSNLESLVGLACDNDFDVMVMYGGYDNTLLEQTVKRFRDTFDAVKVDELGDPEECETPIVFTTDDKDDISINNIDSEVLRDYIEAKVPVFIITRKGADRISQIGDMLAEVSNLNFRALIIDDEGDQASLNNVKDKRNEASATYAAICKMKKILGNPIYFSVTATPHANIFLSELSELRPRSIHLLHPAEGYCGAEVYHINDNDVVKTIEDEMEEALEANRSPDSLRYAIRHFILASAVLRRRNDIKRNQKAQMVIHAYREVRTHQQIYSWANQYLSELKGCVSDALDGDMDAAWLLFKDVYEECIDEETKEANEFNAALIQDIGEVLKKCCVVMQNGDDQGTRGASKHKSYQIYIGAQLLERGITFDHLLTTYFTRWAQGGGNMDTNLQRARWFGYREKYLDLCKLFTTEVIQEEFTNLAEMEDDLWEQFSEVEAGEMSIDDIVIYAENTKQKPTRKTVVDYFPISADVWSKQRYGNFDQRSLKEENEWVEYFILNHDFTEEGFGRKDDKPSCTEAIVSTDDLIELFNGLESVYDASGFSKKEVMHILKGHEHDKAAVVTMTTKSGEARERSFYSDGDNDGKIKALQQGRDERSNAYLGDKAVVDEAYPITVQIYHIRPKKDDEVMEGYTQYMFAIYQKNRVKRGYVAG